MQIQRYNPRDKRSLFDRRVNKNKKAQKWHFKFIFFKSIEGRWIILERVMRKKRRGWTCESDIPYWEYALRESWMRSRYVTTCVGRHIAYEGRDY